MSAKENWDHNLPEYTVSQISQSIRRTVEEQYGYVKIRGEISNFTQARSGHLYLNLKDESSVLAAVCWRGVADKFPFQPEEGLEVICTGKITTYAGQSKYQLVIDYMEPAGIGSLMAMLEKRKAALEKEGLFDTSRKRQLPYLPRRIGIITSPTGAVIQDMLHRIEDRFPSYIQLWPVKVQGEGAAEEIAAAIAGFNAMDNPPDVLIVARGGGSIEDLWAFNEEIVVRATAGSHIPIISAVGHETDTTLIDYASDVRAPTPTAAAEFALPVKRELEQAVTELGLRINAALDRWVEDRTRRITHAFERLPTPEYWLMERRQRVDSLELKMDVAIKERLLTLTQRLSDYQGRLRHPQQLVEMLEERLTNKAQQLKDRVEHYLYRKAEPVALYEKLLESYSYANTLQRGFVLVRDREGKLVASGQNLKREDAVSLEFKDGVVKTIVSEEAHG